MTKYLNVCGGACILPVTGEWYWG